MRSCFMRMRASYELPSHGAIDFLIAATKRLHDRGDLHFSAAEVVPEGRVPWDSDLHFIDVHLALPRSARENFSWPDACERSFGSGTSRDFLSAAGHALSESLERLFHGLGGETSLRPHRNSALSLCAGTWTVFDSQEPSSTKNPWRSRSGEAFHVDEGEALRAAFCEVIERESLAHTLLEGREESFDLSEVALRTSAKAALAKEYWASQGYVLKFCSVPNEWGTWVVLAYVRANDRSSLRAAFKGTACDFTLSHAIEQALSELGRNAFMGPAAKIFSEADLSRALAVPELNPWVGDNLWLISPDKAKVLDRFEDGSPISLKECSARDQIQSPHETLKLFESRRQDLWCIPMARNALGIPGFAYKFFAPSFRQEPCFSGIAFGDI